MLAVLPGLTVNPGNTAVMFILSGQSRTERFAPYKVR